MSNIEELDELAGSGVMVSVDEETKKFDVTVLYHPDVNEQTRAVVETMAYLLTERHDILADMYVAMHSPEPTSTEIIH